MSGFTYKGNWIRLNFKITIGNYKSTIFPEGGVILPGVWGGGLSSRLVVFFFDSRNTFGEGLCYKLKPGHIAYKKIYHD